MRVLAAEAEDGGSRDVGMIDVPGQQAAKIVRIFARAAAAAFVRQEFDAVHIWKKPRRLRTASRVLKRSFRYVVKPAAAVEPSEVPDKLLIALRAREAEFLFESAFEHGEITILAKDQRKNDPVIASSDLAVGAEVAKKGPRLPARDIRRSPVGG